MSRNADAPAYSLRSGGPFVDSVKFAMRGFTAHEIWSQSHVLQKDIS
jgi:hypothetical protein